MEQKTHFIFDLDGTLTTIETLPIIGKHFHMENAIANLTRRAVKGDVPYIENFINRINLLKEVPVDEVAAILSHTPSPLNWLIL